MINDDIIYKTDIAVVSYSKERKLVTTVWHSKKLKFKEYQEPFLAAIEFQKKTFVTNYISDIREQNIIPPDFRKWFQTEILPKAYAAGVKRSAIIFNGNIFKKYYLNNIMNSVKKF
ncbi:MAG: hypothetical protein DRI86_11350, partial [Bacteroidetes bacterium]